MFQNILFIQNKFKLRVKLREAKLELLNGMWDKIVKKITGSAIEKQDTVTKNLMINILKVPKSIREQILAAYLK